MHREGHNLKLLRSGVLAVLLFLGGCDAFEFVMSRIFDDPTTVIRITTTSGEIVAVMEPQVDYLHAIGPGRYDRGAFVEGRGFRTTDGLLEWAAFSTVTLRHGEKAERKGTREDVHEAEVQTKEGATVTKTLHGTPSRGIAGWRKAGGLPTSIGYVWVEIPLATVARVERLESVWERVPTREYRDFQARAMGRSKVECSGRGRLYHPLPIQPNVYVSHDDSALGFRVEERGVLLELDIRDIRDVALAASRDGSTMASFTLNNGEIRTYPTRNFYLRIDSADPACQQLRQADLRSIHVTALP